MAGTPEKIGKTLGIGMRVAGRIAADRMAQSAQSAQSAQTATPNAPQRAAALRNVRQAARQSGGGFFGQLRKTGGAIWLEVMGVFFGMFALWGIEMLYRMRATITTDYRRSIGDVLLTLVFGYFSVSSFRRARRRSA